jgi:class 3 adenylate cyclase
MRCQNCSADNPERARFCADCGAPLRSTLEQPCPNCGSRNPPRARFCADCGAPLASERQELAGGRRGPEAERRQLTVLFCDLVGSTELSDQLDPEDLRDVVRAYQAACAGVIERFEGHIAQYLGDGLLVYFGYPAAHEDDVPRAVRTGLGILDAVAQLNAELLAERGVQLQLAVRAGIHTGTVVVGEMGGGEKREQLALGDTPNIAARAQGLAEAGTVVMTAPTQRLVQGLFESQPLGAHEVRGISRPIPLHRVLREGTAQSRFDVAVSAGLTQLVGREQEAARLLSAWERAVGGASQVVLLAGEPGIGKSRLVQVVKERVASDPHTLVEGRCSPYYQNSALYPLVDGLQRVLELHRLAPADERLHKLERTVARLGMPAREVVPLLAPLLSVPLGERYAAPNLPPQRQKEQTYDALLAMLASEAAEQPVLLVVEDLHWADPSTLELLVRLIDEPERPGPVQTARLLVLLTSRPDFRPPWTLGAR